MGTVLGRRVWSGSRDEEGHREYRIVHRVRTTTIEGPAGVMVTPGLPLVGSIWAFESDLDPWAWCRGTLSVQKASEIGEGEGVTHWDVEQVFSTKPPPVNQQRCNDTQIEDPLLEPPRISGTYNREKEEAVYDRFGVPIKTSSHEMLRGAQNEWDSNRPIVRIEQNVASLLQAVTLPAAMADMLNDAPMWGLPARTIKLTPGPWEKRYYGQCYAYYSRTLEFEIRYEGWDRELLDEGTKVLNGHWDETSGEWTLDQIDGADPDPSNPSHFNKCIDKVGNPMHVVLNGQGQPAGTYVDSGTFYISVIDGNSGNRLKVTSAWRKVVGSTTPAAWDSATKYYPGNLVTSGGRTYISVSRSKGATPTETGFNYWRDIPGILFLRGVYDRTATYQTGDIVQAPGLETEEGYVHVEKYNSANLLLLGVPSSL